LEVFPAIELGHIFKLGTKYSDSMGALFTDEKGEEHPIIMGSYGIGVERVMACYIEQNHDASGIIWNKLLAPFQVHLLGLNLKKQEIVDACEKISKNFTEQSIEVLFDDRDVTAGFKFNDADLLGMPIQIVIGEKKLKENKCEVKVRKTGERFDVELSELMNKVTELLG
jgi:prolyl-tRNA synthetase